MQDWLATEDQDKTAERLVSIEQNGPITASTKNTTLALQRIQSAG